MVYKVLIGSRSFGKFTPSGLKILENNDCDVVKYSRLDEKVWWNDYYKCLENVIQSTSNEEILKYFKSDIDEIKSYKQEPSRFNSMYYIVKKRNE